jgi:hypothetical protein
MITSERTLSVPAAAVPKNRSVMPAAGPAALTANTSGRAASPTRAPTTSGQERRGANTSDSLMRLESAAACSAPVRRSRTTTSAYRASSAATSRCAAAAAARFDARTADTIAERARCISGVSRTRKYATESPLAEKTSPNPGSSAT